MNKIVLIVLLAFLGGCTTVETIPYTVDGQQGVIVARDEKLPGWFPGTGETASYVVTGGATPSERQTAAILAAETACKRYMETRPNELVAMLTSGILYGVFGGIGLGIGAEAFAGTNAREYFRYGAAASGFTGMANGLVTSGGREYEYAGCLNAIIPDTTGVRAIFESPW
jgi:hypothetical protein